MRKTVFIAFLFAVLAPIAQVWAGSTYYAALKTTVKSGSGKVYAANDSTAEANRSYSASTSTSGTRSTDSSGGNVSGFYAYAKPDTGWKFVKWTNTSGTMLSTSAEYGPISLNASTTKDGTQTTEYWAYFEKEVLPSFSITFDTSSAGSYTVNGVAPANMTGLTEATSVTLASSDSTFLNWLINGVSVSDNPYTANCTANTTVSAEFLTADQATSASTYAELTAALSNAAYRQITIPSGTTIAVAKGTTLTVPSGKRLVVNGSLAVAGTLANNGAVLGSGKVYKVYYSIDQGEVVTVYKADGTECGVMECACQTSKMPRYCKTTVTTGTPSVSGTIECTTVAYAVLLNGQSAYQISKQSPKAVKVNVDTAKDANGKQSVVNKITSVVENGNVDALDENANYVLFADCSMTGPVDSSKLRSTAVVDCAGKKLSAGTNSHSSFGICVLNGTFSASASQWQNAHAAFFNMSSVSLSKIKGVSSTYYYYDCGTSASPCTLSFSYYSSTRSSDYRTIYLYSGFYSYTFNTTDDSGKCNVYGGSYTKDPSDYIPAAYTDTLEAKYDGSKYYVVKPATPKVDVAQIGSTKYQSLEAAVSAAANGDVIQLIAGVDLFGSTITVPSGKSITITLDRHSITGGKIVNNGTLVFTDSTTGNGTAASDVSGGTVSSEIENNGTVDFIFGSYSGAIVNKAGTLTTHNGRFAGTLTKSGGTVNLKGGHFTSDISSLATVSGCKVFCNNSLFSVCEVPNGTMSDTSISGIAGYTATPYSNADYALMNTWFGGSTDRASYSTTDWPRLAELLSFYQLFNGSGLDATLAFDRDVASGSVRFYAKTTSSFDSDIDKTISAGELYRGLTAVLMSYNSSSKTYKALWQDNIKSVSLAVADNYGNNAGTLCAEMVELWEGVRASDYSSTGRKITNTVYVAAQKIFTFGAGSNKAMIRPATGAATFYATPAAAMNAVANGGTVMLANDCTTAFSLTKTGTYTFDTMGFAYSGGDPSLGANLFIKSSTAVDSAAKVLVPDAVATTYVVAQMVAQVGDQAYEAFPEAFAAALSNGAVLTLLTDCNYAVALARGQSLKLALASGVAYDAANKITCSTPNYAVRATPASGYTLYEVVFDSDAAILVDTAGVIDGYDDLASALAAVVSGSTITLNEDVTLAAGENAVVPEGVTLSVPQNRTLTVNGALAVMGTLSIAGTVNGSGTVGKNVTLITQTGNGGASPYQAEGSTVKYYKTTTGSKTGTISGTPSCTESAMAVVAKADGTYVCGAILSSSPKMIYCTVNKNDAVNSMSGIASSSTATSFTADVPNGQVAVLLATATISGPTDPDGKIKFGGTIDCADQNCSTASTEVSGDYATQRTVVINCPSFTLTKVVNPKYDFVCCKTIQFQTFNAKYAWTVNFYDCRPQASVRVSSLTDGGTWVMNFYGGQYDTISIKSGGFHSNCKVYAGAYKKDPTSYLGAGGLEVKQEGGYYVVSKRLDEDTAAAKVTPLSGDATFHETLAEAFAAAATGSRIDVLKSAALSSPITVDKELTVDLNGFAITAANGAFVNNGTLYIQDSSNFATPGIVSSASGNVIVNNGTMDITYGMYKGGILLNSGTFTTHGGTFSNTLAAASGADPKVVANLRGGTFSGSVASFLRDGFSQYSGKVGEYPVATVSTDSISGAEKTWKMAFMNAADKTIYGKGKLLSAHSSVADWRRYAELESSLSPYWALTPEGVVKFDRAAASGSVTFYGKAKTTSLPSQALQTDVAAGETYPLIIRLLKANSIPTPYTYSEYVENIESLTIGVKSNNSNNNGTVATFELQFWRPSSMTVGEYVSAGLAPLAQTRYMLGGKKAAIDRGANRLAYDSLTAAVAAVQDGERILIGADCSENVTLPGVGTFTIDHYGFAFTGAVSAPDGLMISSATEGASAAVAQGVTSSHAVTYVVVPEGVAAISGHGYATLASAVDSLADGDEVTLLGDCGESVSVSKVCHFTFDTNGKAYTGQLSAGQGYSLATGVAANGKMDCVVVRGVLSVESATGATLGVSGPEEIPAGYSVSYRVGDGAASNSPVISLPESGCRTNVVKAVLTKDGSSAELTAINSVGVLKVESVSETTAIAVPWYAFGDGGTSVKADSLIYLGNRSAGDELKVYTGSGYEAWELVEVGGVKTWTPIKTVKDGGISVAGAAGNTCVVRGQGLLLTRCDTAAPIYLVGSADGTGTRTTVLAKGTSLVSPPSLSGCDLNAAFPNPGDDAITVQDATGAPKRYTWKNGAWTCDGDGTGLVVPAGTGFIYDNKSDADKSVEW